jgi:pyrrolidone-carboxylate peptidase
MKQITQILDYFKGGTYLSNEIYYRVAFLRSTLKPDKLTGHIHVGFLLDNTKIDRIDMLDTIKTALKQAINNFTI